jgi:hypothetical protein
VLGGAGRPARDRAATARLRLHRDVHDGG